jgi:hypothetical protein
MRSPAPHGDHGDRRRLEEDDRDAVRLTRRERGEPEVEGVARLVHAVEEVLDAPKVISDCHFAAQLNHFIPGFLSYPVAVFLT